VTSIVTRCRRSTLPINVTHSLGIISVGAIFTAFNAIFHTELALLKLSLNCDGHFKVTILGFTKDLMKLFKNTRLGELANCLVELSSVLMLCILRSTSLIQCVLPNRPTLIKWSTITATQINWEIFSLSRIRHY
jgi:hypothetical protein